MGINITLIALYNAENNISLRALHSYLKQNGHTVQLIYFKDFYYNLFESASSRDREDLISVIRDFNPRVIGVNVGFSSLFEIASEITRDLQRNIQVPVIWGGTHPNISPETCITVADGICLLEGEIPFLELVNRLETGEDYADIQNFWFRLNGEVRKNPCREPLMDYDIFPLPDFSNDGKVYINNGIRFIDPNRLLTWQYMLLTSSICPCECSFCCNHIMKKLAGRPFIRQRGVEMVIRELELVKEMLPNVNMVYFVDEVFFNDREWLLEFAEKYRNRVNLPFCCMFSSRFVNDDTLQILKPAGLFDVNLGVQSGSERVRRDIYNRPESDEEIRSAAECIVRNGLLLKLNLIFDNPYEKPEDKEAAFRFFLSLPKPFEKFNFSLIYFPNTMITQRALQDGIISPKDVEDHSKKAFTNMEVNINAERPTDELFWISIVSLTGKYWIPNFLIEMIYRSSLFRNHPKLLKPMIVINSRIVWLIKGIKFILMGQNPWIIIRKRWRHLVESVK